MSLPVLDGAHSEAMWFVLGLMLAAYSQEPRLRADAELVLIPATVLDERDRLVEGLERRHVQVYQNGVEQAVKSLSLEDGPVSLIVVLDVSRSMRHGLPEAQGAIGRLAELAKPGDEYALITFRDRPELRLPFPSTAQRVAEAASTEHAEGSTALYDALVLAVNHLRKGANARKAILLLSDGGEQGSRYTASELRQVLREAGAPVYAFVLPSFIDEGQWWELGQMIAETGGRRVQVATPSQFGSRLEELEVRRHYLVGFAPPSTAKHEGRYQKVQVKVNGRRLRVYFRQGYFPTVSAQSSRF